MASGYRPVKEPQTTGNWIKHVAVLQFGKETKQVLGLSSPYADEVDYEAKVRRIAGAGGLHSKSDHLLVDGKAHIYLQLDENLCMIVFASEHFPQHLIRGDSGDSNFMDALKDALDEPLVVRTLRFCGRMGLNVILSAKVTELMRQFNRRDDSLGRAARVVDQAKDSVLDTLSKATERTAMLERMEVDTDTLATSARAFRSTARQLEYTMCFRKYFFYLIIAVVLVILAIGGVLIANYTTFHWF